MQRPARKASLERAWPWAALVFFALDVVLLFAARPVHRVFEGELGIVELPTFLFLLAAVPFAACGALRSRGRDRVLFSLLALGGFYWGMEEISWGQTFFHWATPSEFQGNYQHETNLHNERGPVGTLLNVIPRFALLTLSILSVLLNVPAFRAVRAALGRVFPPRWGDELAACWVPAALSLADSLLNKLRPLHRHGHGYYMGFGETQELFLAIMLFRFVLLHLRDDAALRREPKA